mgnify:CR=1 FL=1
MKHIGNLSYNEGAKHKKKRIGRGQGSGHGGTSTRGHKGQKSRSGSSIPRGFEGGQMPIHRRLPKYGFSNHNFKKHFQILNLGDIQKFIESGKISADSVNFESLKKTGVLSSNDPLKVLGNGEITTAITVEAAHVSAAAKEKIENAGGKVVTNG